MKNFINKTFRISAILAGLFMTSCLDDTGYTDIYNKENNTPVVSFGQADHGYVVRTIDVTDNPGELAIDVNVARATEAVTVTIEVDPTLLDAYNEAEGTEYELLPDSSYSIPSGSVTVPAGELDANFVFQAFADEISLDYAYILPLRITSSTGAGAVVASNLNTALVSVGVKNQYDGVYTVESGSITRYFPAFPEIDPSLSGNFAGKGVKWTMSTLTANAVTLGMTWVDGSGVGGVDPITLTIDPATNELSIESGANDSMTIIPGTVHTYDPATRTFTLSYYWNPGASNERRVDNVVLVYSGPRP
jgi:hypothetical protein